MTRPAMAVRKATPSDIGAMHRIRLTVRENLLSDASKVTEASYEPYVAAGTAWVVERGGIIAGFSAVDGATQSVWALFVDRAFEGIGVGRTLHDHMVQWASDHDVGRLSLTTAPGTRADRFYRKLGWAEVGRGAGDEVVFEKLVGSTQTPR